MVMCAVVLLLFPLHPFPRVARDELERITPKIHSTLIGKSTKCYIINQDQNVRSTRWPFSESNNRTVPRVLFINIWLYYTNQYLMNPPLKKKTSPQTTASLAALRA